MNEWTNSSWKLWRGENTITKLISTIHGTELPGKSLYKRLWQDIADSQTDWYVGLYGQMTWVTLLLILDPTSHLHEKKPMSRLYTYSTNRKNSDWKWEKGHGL